MAGPKGPRKETLMKKTTPKKMTISRETLAVLGKPEEMKKVFGGAESDRCTTSHIVCCP